MEMYADPTARGGVLEPEGIVEVKYKKRDLLKTMHRLDHVLKELDDQLKTFQAAQPVRERFAKTSVFQLLVITLCILKVIKHNTYPTRTREREAERTEKSRIEN